MFNIAAYINALMKRLLLIGAAALAFLSSCKKSDGPRYTVRYETTGVSKFYTAIYFKDADKKMDTVYQENPNFSYSFEMDHHPEPGSLYLALISLGNNASVTIKVNDSTYAHMHGLSGLGLVAKY